MRITSRRITPVAAGIGLLLLGALSWLDAQPQIAPDARFAGLQWTFARIRYDAWTLPPGRRYDIYDEPWTIDYPAAEQKIGDLLAILTGSE